MGEKMDPGSMVRANDGKAHGVSCCCRSTMMKCATTLQRAMMSLWFMMPTLVVLVWWWCAGVMVMVARWEQVASSCFESWFLREEEERSA